MFVRVNFEQPINNLVQEFLTDEYSAAASSRPAVDITENETGSTFFIELPGVKKEDIRISVENGWLTVNGERKPFEESEIKRVLHRETRNEAFARTIKLPHRVDLNTIAAELENGILKISLPKAEEVRPRTIEIK
ncbi:MAG TPA: Hsp20/alpha crystallin family protein [Bacteroidota bacterium]